MTRPLPLLSTTLQSRRFDRGLLVAGLALIGLALRLDSPATYILLALTFFPLTVMGGALGIAQGQELHAKLASVYLAVGVPKALVTIATLVALATFTAGMLGLAAGSALGAFDLPGCWFGDSSAAGTLDTRRCCAKSRTTYAMLALFALTNLDIVLGRVFLTRGRGSMQ
ncbi:MAG: hypothetical protein R2687_01005 [Candidatus Nanopelagicales bacterium]